MADQQEQEANRLYWESDTSVAAIADRLGISRRALYDAILPLPAGAACPECGEALGFRNRTAAARGEADCPGCGAEVDARHRDEDGPPDMDSPQIEQEQAAARLSPVDAVRTVTRAGGAALGALLLAGLALGAAVGYLVRRS